MKSGFHVPISAIMGSSAFYVASGLDSGTEYTYTLIATDTAGNTADGVDVTVETKALAVTAEPKYTGSILVTWTEGADYNADGEEVSYTYSVSGATSAAGAASVTEQTELESGTTGAHFTGLTVGSAYTFTVTPSSTVSAATSEAVTAKTVVWQLINQYDNSNKWTLIPALTSSSESYYTITKKLSELPGSYTYTNWIVRPGLDGTDGSVSFEAAPNDGNGLGSGLYLYNDYTGSRRSDSAKGAGSTNWSHIAKLNDSKTKITNGSQAELDLSAATFTLAESTSTTSVVSGYSKWHWIKQSYSGTTYMLCDDWNTDSAVAFSENTGNQYNWAYKQIGTYNVDYSVDAPAAATPGTAAVTSGTVNSVDLTWTNPEDVDFGYVVITCSDSSVASVTSTSTSATITGLTASTSSSTVSYTFTITAYDVYGNASESASFTAVTMPEGSDKPTEVTATVGWTGHVVVTWSDANTSSDFTYTVTAVPTSGDTVTKEAIAQGTQKVGFTGLTVGTEYTFTVTASNGNAGDNTPTVTPVKTIWKITSGYGARDMVSNILTSDTVGSCTSYYNCVAQDPSKTDNNNSGNCAAVMYSAIKYPYWIVMPSLNDSSSLEEFSLMATDSTGAESGYYLYNDYNRSVIEASNLSHWWTELSGINSRKPKLFVATLDGSENDGTTYITDNKLASYSWVDYTYNPDGGTWYVMVNVYDGYYVRHNNLSFNAQSSMCTSSTSENGNDARCTALKYTIVE